MTLNYRALVKELIHPAVALGIQFLLWLLFGNLWVGAAAASAFFLSREIAQAEYKWIEHYGGGLRANMPWHAVFDRRVWDMHSLLGFLLPASITFAVAGLAS